jgi:hypothetical protein
VNRHGKFWALRIDRTQAINIPPRTLRPITALDS